MGRKQAITIITVNKKGNDLAFESSNSASQYYTLHCTLGHSLKVIKGIYTSSLRQYKLS